MYPISEHLKYFLAELALGKKTISAELLHEYGELCKQRVQESIAPEARVFNLRMSNIGRDIRQLWLEKTYGKNTIDPAILVKMIYGHTTEALFIMLFKAAGIPVEIPTEKISMTLLDGTVVSGLPDIKVDGEIVDLKTASNYSYTHKFESFNTLKADDSFGYLGQGAGYSIADGLPFGGWFVIDKSTGDYKDVPVPPSFNSDKTRQEYLEEFTYKSRVLNGELPVPDCAGVEEETFYGKPTGNKIVGPKCKFCACPSICHPDSQVLPQVKSKAKSPTLVRYIGEVKDGQ